MIPTAVDGWPQPGYIALVADRPWRTEGYRRDRGVFCKTVRRHAYKLESSLDGKNWAPYGGHPDIALRSPHVDKKPSRARYLRVTILAGEPGIWEFRVY